MITIVSVVPRWANIRDFETGSRTDASKKGTSANTTLRAATSEPRPDPILVMKWICHTANYILSSPALADINGDGHLEVLVHSFDGNLYCLSCRGEPIWTYPMSSYGITSPAIADIDGDGKLEILMIDDNGGGGVFSCLSSTGMLKWSFYTPYTIPSSPAIADIDGDGKPEVVVKAIWDSMGIYVYCLNSTGGPKWTHFFAGEGIVDMPSSSPAVGDIDGDGKMEVFVGAMASQSYCLNGTGAVKWYANNLWTFASPSIVDLDGDGHLEVVTGDHCLNGTGAIKWTFSPIVYSSPAVADIDADGGVEVMIGSWPYLYCLDSTGAIKWSFNAGNGIVSSPAIADVDADGRLDIIVGCFDHRLYCVNNTGGLEWSYTAGDYVYSSPTIADIDDDGRLEIVFGSGDGNVYCLSVHSGPAISCSYAWPSIGYLGDIRHSSCYVYSDGDWLTDNYEKTAGTNPLVTDTDGDSAPDSVEFAKSTNPLIDSVPPEAITDLTISKPTNDSVTLTWTAPGDNGVTGTATGYVVRYSTAGPITGARSYNENDYYPSWTPLSSGSLENHTLTGLTPDTVYWFSVKAYDAIHNCAGVSNSPGVKTIDTVAPCKIADLQIIGVVGANVTLTWTAPGDNGASGTATSYEVKYSRSGPVNDISWVSATTYPQSWLPRSTGSTEVHAVTGLVLNTTYWFAVRAQDEIPNVGAVSNSPCGMTAAPPIIITVTIVQNNTLVENRTVIVTVVQNNTIVQNRTIYLPVESGAMSLVGVGVGGTGVLVALVALGFAFKKKS
jgi:hypothetical protein